MTSEKKADRPKYEYGQQLFAASWETSTEHVTCPDCGGTKILHAHLWDGSIHCLDCVGCAGGYDPPRGYLVVHKRQAIARPATVSSVEREWDGSGFRYRADTGWGNQYIFSEGDLFMTEPEALEAATKMAFAADQEERAKVGQKEKPLRTWAWNVHYHRRAIRDAEKNLAYHTAKLNAAKPNITK